MALQKRLQELGYTVNDFEGRIDFDLRNSIRLEQAKHGMRAGRASDRGAAGEDRGEGELLALSERAAAARRMAKAVRSFETVPR